MQLRTSFALPVLVIVLIVENVQPAVSSPAAAGQQSATAQRPTDVTIVMSTSRGKYDGTYQLTQRSRICGELKAEENFAGVRMFELDFPDGGDSDINDVSFGSKALVGGVTTTDSFGPTFRRCRSASYCEIGCTAAGPTIARTSRLGGGSLGRALEANEWPRPTSTGHSWSAAANSPPMTNTQTDQPLTAQVLDPPISRWKNGSWLRSRR